MDTLNKSVTPIDSDEPECNTSSNPWFADTVERRYGRREIVVGGAAATAALLAAPALAHATVTNGAHGNACRCKIPDSIRTSSR